MEALARRILQKPVEVQVGGRSVVSNEIEQHAFVVEEDKKFLKLLEVVGNYVHLGSVLVFVDKQEHADGLLKDLMNAGYTSCASLHGGIDQYDRDSTIVDFKSSKTQILVATSVAARGLDVKKLVLVVNYDCPNHYEDYVHRPGRQRGVCLHLHHSRAGLVCRRYHPSPRALGCPGAPAAASSSSPPPLLLLFSSSTSPRLLLLLFSS